MSSASIQSHGHGSCSCGHDHHDHPVRGGHPRSHVASGLWATVVPVLACAVCPACVSTYAKVFATIGVAAALSERQHLALLVFAVITSVAVSAYRSWRSRRAWPVLVAVAGCTFLSAGHLLEANALEWLGMAILIIGGMLERRATRRVTRAAEPGLASA
jgi:hypothetical protein